ncbi:DUF4241 domain-containing protein [Nocardia sp. NBC_01499]|uniref:DUF4241 domain-containing protein n=1 Tax=Nocardia sp. NBC_01499 TaxID=2903597 RepID=UPI003869A052
MIGMDGVDKFVRAGWFEENRVVDEGLKVRYCEGWDDGAVVGPLSAREARARDESGAQYAVAIVASDGKVVAYAEIAWGARFARCWQIDAERWEFDDTGRWQRIEYRRLDDGRLFLFDAETWYDAGVIEPDTGQLCSHRRWAFFPPGRVRGEFTYCAGGSGGRGFDVDPAELTLAWEFGDWATLCGLKTAVPLQELPDPEREPGIQVTPPWRPPEPIRPPALAELFTPGTVFELTDGSCGEMDVYEVGLLMVGNSGLVIGDPGALEFDNGWKMDLPPGGYPIELAEIIFDDETRIAAAKVVVGEHPPVSWELLAQDDTDFVFLHEDEHVGFGVDSGTAAFVDADSIDEILDSIEAGLQAADLDDLGFPGLISFESGWGDGSYPVWIGRDQNNDVSEVVADFRVAHEARVISEQTR